MTRFSCCPLCGSQKLGPLFEIAGQGVDRCSTCSLVLLNPQPECTDELLYAEEYYRGTCSRKEGGQENVLEPDRVERRLESCRGVLEKIERMLGRKGSVLDLGCGPGFLLKVAQDAGWCVAGADVSRFAASYARERFGLRDVVTAPLEGVVFPFNSFDVVTLQHVIEHFRDPVRMVCRIKDWLVPGGLIWVETPDIDSGGARRAGKHWIHVKVPEHLFYFSERTLIRLLVGQGFQILSAHREVKGTGFLEAACGGLAEAKQFYERARENPIFRMLVRTVRYVNEIYRARLKGESDVIRLLARKIEGP
jgi:2-polyprenyl-3-methyl-5-hydroxy-6-metoxy-1,4-benzoquinol methylase